MQLLKQSHSCSISVGMKQIFDQGTARTTCLRFGHNSSELLAWGSADGSVRIATLQEPSRIMHVMPLPRLPMRGQHTRCECSHVSLAICNACTIQNAVDAHFLALHGIDACSELRKYGTCLALHAFSGAVSQTMLQSSAMSHAARCCWAAALLITPAQGRSVW